MIPSRDVLDAFTYIYYYLDETSLFGPARRGVSVHYLCSIPYLSGEGEGHRSSSGEEHRYSL